MRSLAHIEEITNIRPIEGCDNICQATVLGWNLIVKKEEFKEGDKCVYIEIDSIVPSDNPIFAFLEKKKYKIKTMKMKGTISQGLALPVSILLDGEQYNIGDDVTKILGIEKISDEVPKIKGVGAQDISRFMFNKFPKFTRNRLGKTLLKKEWFKKIVRILFKKQLQKKNGFPIFVSKTDETRVQNYWGFLQGQKDKTFIVTEKLDGTSATFALEHIGKKKTEFYVCSRNLRLSEKDGLTKDMEKFFSHDVYNQMANEYNIRKILESFSCKTVVIQGEIVGPSIQKNKYKLSNVDFYAFNLIVDGKKYNPIEAKNILGYHGIKFVPILNENFKLLNSVDEMVTYADGLSTLEPTLREGVVLRDVDMKISFKCISNKFLLKHNL